ncbi:MAG: N-acetylglucosamine-6-phosphate deacetylase [Candidatus Gastranaerophilaceae bacterium]
MQELKKSKLLIEQHFHGAFGVDFSFCSVEDVLKLSKKLLQHGIGGFFPTLVTDSVNNIKHQIEVFKTAKKEQTEDMAEILGVHIEGIFLNPSKKGIHDESQFLDVTIENYKKIEDDFIKIVTLAPELDTNGSLRKYLVSKGIKVQAGHCVGGDLTNCTGATHLFNAMSGISHRSSSTALSALINDNIYTEIIADGIHLNDDTITLALKTKPKDKILLISDCLPITNSNLKQMVFCNKDVFYDGEKATDENGTIAGSTSLLDTIVKRLLKKNIDVLNIINNTYKYHSIDIDGLIIWKNNEIIEIKKNGKTITKKV